MEPIKIGLITGFTGPHSAMTAHQRMGAILAVEEFNQKNGHKRKSTLLERDDAMSPQKAGEFARELVDNQHVDVLVGTLSASTLVEVNKVAVEEGVLCLGICQSNVVTDGSHLGPYTFHESLTPHISAQMIGRWALEHLGKRWYFIHYEQQFGPEALRSYQEIIPRLGGTILGSRAVPSGLSIEDYEKIFPEIVALKPDVLSISSFGQDQINFVHAAHKHGLTREMSIIHTISDLFLIGRIGLEELVGMYWGVNFYHGIEETNPSAKAFVKKFRDRWDNTVPSGYAAYAYSALAEFFSAVEETGIEHIDKDAIARFLEGRNYDHTKGRQWWRPCDHQSFQDIYMMRFKGPEESKDPTDIGEIIDTVHWELDIERTCEELGHQQFLGGHISHL